MDAEIVDRIPEHAGAIAMALDGVPVVGAGQRVGNPAIADIVKTAQLYLEAGKFRQIEVSGDFLAAPVAHACRHIKIELTGWFARHDADGTAHGVAPEERALRTTQDFHALNVGEFHAKALHPAEINAVDIDAHRRVTADLGGVIGHKAAHPDVGSARAARNRHGAKRRNGPARQVHDVVDAAGFKRLGTKDGNGDWRILYRLCPLLGGHDNFANSLER